VILFTPGRSIGKSNGLFHRRCASTLSPTPRHRKPSQPFSRPRGLRGRLAGHPPLAARSAHHRRQAALRQPVLFILEDLHWTDPSILELLGLLLDQTPTASLLVLLTCRPYFQPAWHHRSYLTEITVNRLSHAQVEQIVTGMTDGKTMPHEVLAQVVEKTDGVPLFVEEMTKAILESGHLKDVDGHYDLIGSFSTFAIPATLQDLLMNIETAASHMLYAQCVETGHMPHIEPPTRPCDRGAAMEANLCRLAS
jgi:hypothetical protein